MTHCQSLKTSETFINVNIEDLEKTQNTQEQGGQIRL